MSSGRENGASKRGTYGNSIPSDYAVTTPAVQLSTSKGYLVPVSEDPPAYDNNTGWNPRVNGIPRHTVPIPPPDYPYDLSLDSRGYLSLLSSHHYSSAGGSLNTSIDFDDRLPTVDTASILTAKKTRSACCNTRTRFAVTLTTVFLAVGFISLLVLDYMEVIDLNIIPERHVGPDKEPFPKPEITTPVIKDSCKGQYDIEVWASVSFQCIFNVTSFGSLHVSTARNHEMIVKSEVHMNYEADNYVKNGSFILLAWIQDDSLITKVEVREVTCLDQGHYSIQIFDNETLLETHRFDINVLYKPAKPVFQKVPASRGSVPGEVLELVCSTTVGCNGTMGLTFKKKAKGTTIFVSTEDIKFSMFNKTETGLYQETSYLDVQLNRNSDGDEYRCDVNGVDEMIMSDNYKVSIVQEDFCEKFKNSECMRGHPNRCDLWVWCQGASNTVIMECPSDQHWRQDPIKECFGACKHANKTNCG